jgi:hypothetical protein
MHEGKCYSAGILAEHNTSASHHASCCAADLRGSRVRLSEDDVDLKMRHEK